MTEKERRKRRQEMERRMRARRSGQQRPQQTDGRGLLIFRTYVTVILAGAFFVVSLFQTETAEMVCSRLKETIAYQIPIEDISTAKEKLAAFWRSQDFTLPVFDEQKNDEKETTVYRPDLDESP